MPSVGVKSIRASSPRGACRLLVRALGGVAPASSARTCRRTASRTPSFDGSPTCPATTAVPGWRSSSTRRAWPTRRRPSGPGSGCSSTRTGSSAWARARSTGACTPRSRSRRTRWPSRSRTTPAGAKAAYLTWRYGDTTDPLTAAGAVGGVPLLRRRRRGLEPQRSARRRRWCRASTVLAAASGRADLQATAVRLDAEARAFGGRLAVSQVGIDGRRGWCVCRCWQATPRCPNGVGHGARERRRRVASPLTTGTDGRATVTVPLPPGTVTVAATAEAPGSAQVYRGLPASPNPNGAQTLVGGRTTARAARHRPADGRARHDDDDHCRRPPRWPRPRHPTTRPDHDIDDHHDIRQPPRRSRPPRWRWSCRRPPPPRPPRPRPRCPRLRSPRRRRRPRSPSPPPLCRQRQRTPRCRARVEAATVGSPSSPPPSWLAASACWAPSVAAHRPTAGPHNLRGMTPVEALERVVHYLDRAHDTGFKTKAFVRALDVVRALPPDEVDERGRGRHAHRPRGHRRLLGDGDPRGARRRRSTVPRPSSTRRPRCRSRPAGAVYRNALRGDLHLHSRWSDGGATIEAMARTAMALGHEYMVLTDHSPRLTIAHGLSAGATGRSNSPTSPMLNERLAPFRILTGIEVDILEDGTLDHGPEVLALLDVVVASVHSKLRMAGAGDDGAHGAPRSAIPNVDILGHCTGRMIGKRDPSTFDADYVFAACAQFRTAVEINCRPERLDPPRPLLQLAVELRLLVLHRQRRAQHRPARVAAPRLRPGRRGRCAAGAGDQHLARCPICSTGWRGSSPGGRRGAAHDPADG